MSAIRKVAIGNFSCTTRWFARGNIQQVQSFADEFFGSHGSPDRSSELEGTIKFTEFPQPKSAEASGAGGRRFKSLSPRPKNQCSRTEGKRRGLVWATSMFSTPRGIFSKVLGQSECQRLLFFVKSSRRRDSDSIWYTHHGAGDGQRHLGRNHAEPPAYRQPPIVSVARGCRSAAVRYVSQNLINGWLPGFVFLPIDILVRPGRVRRLWQRNQP